MIVTIVHHLLKDFMKDHGGKLPRKLHLNLGKDELINSHFSINISITLI